MNYGEEEIFDLARKIDCAEARAEYIAQACGTDGKLRDRVARLLDVYERDRSYLEQPPTGLAETENSAAVTEKAGDTIGPYKLLQRIGEGGFGVVYMAEQHQPVRRKVALKVIKPGMDTKEVVARFEAERQALALMDHPNIAKVFDGGATDSGRPYFVMELVKGVALTDFCDQNKLTTRQRLELFATVCRAIQHAHQKGVIHRDLKPSNVMVTLHDGKPVAKVIDFGVSKAISQQLTERTMFTAYGQMIGTPQYMSPEQAEMSGLDIDTRSDIYSLGVLLYELLTGSTPLKAESLRGKAFAELQRMIREDEPPRPSIRLSTQGELTASVASQRGTDPKKLGALLRGELDWIVMKALDKERSRRYETANGLAADVQRYLNDEAVEACPPTFRYRLRKFARRNKALFAVASMITLALLIGLIATTSQWIRARNAELLAKSEANRAQAAESNEKLAANAARSERDRADQSLKTLERQNYTLRLQQAAAALRNKDRVGARELLEACPAELRGWEWDHLSWRARPSYLLTLPGSKIPRFTPSGYFITRAAGEKVERVIRTLDMHSGDVVGEYPMAVDRPGSEIGEDFKYLVGCYGTVLEPIGVCDITTGKLLWPSKPREKLARHNYSVSPGGTTFATQDIDSEVTLWDTKTGERLAKSQPLNAALHGADFSPDGTRLALGHLILDAKTLSVLVELDAADDGLPVLTGSSIAWSPDGRSIATGDEDQNVRIWNASTGELLLKLKGDADIDLAYSKDGKRIAGNTTSTISLYDFEQNDGDLQMKIIGRVRCGRLEFSPDSTMLVTRDYSGGGCHVWNALATGRDNVLVGHQGPVRAIAFSPDNKDLISAGADGTLRRWDVANRALKLAIQEAVSSTHIVYGPGDVLATVSGSSIVFREATTLTPLKSFPNHERTDAFSLSPNGKYLAANSRTLGKVTMWETSTREQIDQFNGRNSSGIRIAWSADSRWIAFSAPKEEPIAIREIASGTVIRSLPTRFPQQHEVQFTADGRLACGFDQQLVYYDPKTGDELARFPCESLGDFLNTKRLVSIRDSNLYFTDADTGQQLVALQSSSPRLTDFAISPDGRTIATAGVDGKIHIWETNPRTITAAARKRYMLAVSVVERVSKNVTFRHQMIDAIRQDESLEVVVRTLAVELIEENRDYAQERELAEQLQNEGLSVVMQSSASLSEYSEAFDKLTTACRVLPTSAIYRSSLGIAQYRVGDFTGALGSLHAAQKRFAEMHPDRDYPPIVAFLAMTLHRLGRHDEAREQLDRLQRWFDEDRWGGNLEMYEQFRQEAYELISKSPAVSGG